MTRPLPAAGPRPILAPFLAADVGGTHVRVGLVTASPEAPTHYRKFACADFPGLAAILEAYLAELPAPALVRRGVIACAGHPLEDGSLRQYKAALQGTFGVAAAERFIHGWQTIGRFGRADNSWSADMLYLAGYRISTSWSLFSMQGVRRAKPSDSIAWAGILNPGIFRPLNQR